MALCNRTILISLGMAVLLFATRYLPWLTDGSYSMSLTAAYAEKPSLFGEICMMMNVGIVWIVIWQILYFPKTSLVGILPLLVALIGCSVTASNYQLKLALGSSVYIVALLVFVFCAFWTPGIKRQTPDILRTA